MGSVPGPVIKIPQARPPKIRDSRNHNNTNLTLRNPLHRIYMEDFGNSLSWNLFEADVNIPDGIHALYLIYHGDKKVQLKEIILK